MNGKKVVWGLMLLFGLESRVGLAHDTWLEVGASRVPVGEFAYVNLMLGNHGNEHRDFKISSKITLEPCELYVIGPDGKTSDLKSGVVDLGFGPKEGHWAARCDFNDPGVYRVVHTLDTLHLTTRAIKSSKTFVIAGEKTTEAVGEPQDSCFGFGLELVLETPYSELHVGNAMSIRVMRNGEPLSDARVSIVPRGVTLAEGFDQEYERISDNDGRVRFVPQEGNIYLLVVHHLEAEEKGEGYDKSHYSATMVLHVANRTRQH